MNGQPAVLITNRRLLRYVGGEEECRNVIWGCLLPRDQLKVVNHISEAAVSATHKQPGALLRKFCYRRPINYSNRHHLNGDNASAWYILLHGVQAKGTDQCENSHLGVRLRSKRKWRQNMASFLRLQTAVRLLHCHYGAWKHVCTSIWRWRSTLLEWILS